MTRTRRCRKLVWSSPHASQNFWQAALSEEQPPPCDAPQSRRRPLRARPDRHHPAEGQGRPAATSRRLITMAKNQDPGQSPSRHHQSKPHRPQGLRLGRRPEHQGRRARRRRPVLGACHPRIEVEFNRYGELRKSPRLVAAPHLQERRSALCKERVRAATPASSSSTSVRLGDATDLVLLQLVGKEDGLAGEAAARAAAARRPTSAPPSPRRPARRAPPPARLRRPRRQPPTRAEEERASAARHELRSGTTPLPP
jgi:hypothetical protein